MIDIVPFIIECVATITTAAVFINSIRIDRRIASQEEPAVIRYGENAAIAFTRCSFIGPAAESPAEVCADNIIELLIVINVVLFTVAPQPAVVVFRIKRIFQITDLRRFKAGGLGLVKRTEQFSSYTVVGVFGVPRSSQLGRVAQLMVSAA